MNSSILTEAEIKERCLSLLTYLPKYYEEVKEVIGITETEFEEFFMLKVAKDAVLRQFFVETATLGLDQWEEVVGINSDTSQSYSDRREVVKARLRGSGTTTDELLRNVAESFSGGTSEIIQDYEDYSFVVKFISKLGIPTQLEKLREQIELIKPAHLAFTFAFTYVVWANLLPQTWEYIQGFNITWEGISTTD